MGENSLGSSGNIDSLLHQVFDQSSAGFQIIDREWKYVFVNPAVVMQGKSTEKELIGHTMMEVYPGIENTELFVKLKMSMENKAVIRMDNHFIYPDGTKGWFKLFIHPWSNGIMIFSFDITNHKNDEINLRFKLEELESSIKSEEDKQKISEIKKKFAKIHEPEVSISN